MQRIWIVTKSSVENLDDAVAVWLGLLRTLLDEVSPDPKSAPTCTTVSVATDSSMLGGILT